MILLTVSCFLLWNWSFTDCDNITVRNMTFVLSAFPILYRLISPPPKLNNFIYVLSHCVVMYGGHTLTSLTKGVHPSPPPCGAWRHDSFSLVQSTAQGCMSCGTASHIETAFFHCKLLYWPQEGGYVLLFISHDTQHTECRGDALWLGPSSLNNHCHTMSRITSRLSKCKKSKTI